MHSSTDIPLVEPTEVTAGDTIQWRREDLTEHYPASTWTLTYYAYGLPGKFNVVATADGDEFAIEVTATASQAWQEGDYTVKGYVTKDAQRFEVYSGRLTVAANPVAIPEQFDDRSFAKKSLDAIESMLAGRAGRADRSYQIAGRSLEHFSLKELQDARARFKAEVAAENGTSNRRILTRFTAVT